MEGVAAKIGGNGFCTNRLSCLAKFIPIIAPCNRLKILREASS